MKFKELNLHPTLEDALEKIGYVELTPIQAKSIPYAMQGTDVTGLAQTGTGKTMAFLLPTLHRFLSAEEQPSSPYALVLSPTRELTMQIGEEAEKLLKNTNFGVATIIGGSDYKAQEKALKNAILVVATPGRLMDFVKNHGLSLDAVQVVIIDEADRMFDMGFVQDLKYIFHKCKNRKQSLLFSATLSYEIVRLASKYLVDPVEVHINPEKVITERIEQSLLHLGKEEKIPYLINSLLQEPIEGLGIIFTNYKMNIPRIITSLRNFGITATGLSSELDQKKRIRLLRDFKAGKYKFLVATDVASRGIDIDNIDVVYNYDLPQDAENYVHRIGRTARAGRKGKSIAFCSEADYSELERIENYLNSKIPVGSVNETYLKYPEGEFTPVFSDEPVPGERKGRPESNGRRPARKEPGRGRREPAHKSRKERNETDSFKPSSSIPAQNPGPRSPKNKNRDKDRNNERGNEREQRNPRKEHNNSSAKPQNTDKSRRNLFDLEEIKKTQTFEKKSLWTKLTSWFRK